MVDGTLLLTGASGLLGTWLLRTVPPGLAVVGVIHRRPLFEASTTPAVPAATVDLRDAESTRTALQEIRPSLVVHAAYAKDRTSIVDATQHVVDAAADVGAAVLFVSTDVVFPGDGVARDEAATPDPTFDYGRWKARAEEIVAGRSASNTIVRLSLIVSVDPDDQAVARIRTAADRGETTRWFSDELRQPALASEVAEGLWRIAGAPERSGVWHLPGPETLSRYDIARRTVDVLGLDPTVVAPEPAPPDSDRPRHLELRDDRARSEIGWAPSPVLSPADHGDRRRAR